MYGGTAIDMAILKSKRRLGVSAQKLAEYMVMCDERQPKARMSFGYLSSSPSRLLLVNTARGSSTPPVLFHEEYRGKYSASKTRPCNYVEQDNRMWRDLTA